MMKILFSDTANADLMEFVTFIANDKPAAARRWADAIRRSVMKLADFPKMGRIVPEYSDDTIREILKGQYRIVYKIDSKNDTIVILTIHHSKKRLI